MQDACCPESWGQRVGVSSPHPSVSLLVSEYSFLDLFIYKCILFFLSYYATTSLPASDNHHRLGLFGLWTGKFAWPRQITQAVDFQRVGQDVRTCLGEPPHGQVTIQTAPLRPGSSLCWGECWRLFQSSEGSFGSWDWKNMGKEKYRNMIGLHVQNQGLESTGNLLELLFGWTPEVCRNSNLRKCLILSG